MSLLEPFRYHSLETFRSNSKQWITRKHIVITHTATMAPLSSSSTHSKSKSSSDDGKKTSSKGRPDRAMRQDKWGRFSTLEESIEVTGVKKWWKVSDHKGRSIKLDKLKDVPKDYPVFLWEDRSMYLGNWMQEDDGDWVPHGFGVFCNFAEGDVTWHGYLYVGDFDGGELHGAGKAIWLPTSQIWISNTWPGSPIADPDDNNRGVPFIYEGQYHENKMHGKAVCELKNGERSTGTFSEGKVVGQLVPVEDDATGNGLSKDGKGKSALKPCNALSKGPKPLPEKNLDPYKYGSEDEQKKTAEFIGGFLPKLGKQKKARYVAGFLKFQKEFGFDPDYSEMAEFTRWDDLEFMAVMTRRLVYEKYTGNPYPVEITERDRKASMHDLTGSTDFEKSKEAMGQFVDRIFPKIQPDVREQFVMDFLKFQAETGFDPDYEEGKKVLNYEDLDFLPKMHRRILFARYLGQEAP